MSHKQNIEANAKKYRISLQDLLIIRNVCVCDAAGQRRGASDEGPENIPDLRGHQRHPEAVCGS